jgi:triosephosphate isomerase
MNGTSSFAEAYGAFFREKYQDVPKNTFTIICPPAPYLKILHDAAQGIVLLGIQNTATERKGAFTGEISADMAADMGCRYGLVGHSERRHLYQENNTIVFEKAVRLAEAGITPILCVGETYEQREAGQTACILAQQLQGMGRLPLTQEVIVAYEPVWAIGTGKTPTPQNVQETHRTIHAILRAEGLSAIPLLYGGSVTAANAKDFVSLEEVQGVLVGGASLKCEEFLSIVQSIEL